MTLTYVYVIRSIASRLREVILPLCSALLRHFPETLSSGLGSPAQERHGADGVGPEETTKTIRVMEQLFHEGRLSKLGLFNLVRSLSEYFSVAFQYLKGIYRKAEEELFQ